MSVGDGMDGRSGGGGGGKANKDWKTKVGERIKGEVGQFVRG